MEAGRTGCSDGEEAVFKAILGPGFEVGENEPLHRVSLLIIRRRIYLYITIVSRARLSQNMTKNNNIK